MLLSFLLCISENFLPFVTSRPICELQIWLKERKTSSNTTLHSLSLLFNNLHIVYCVGCVFVCGFYRATPSSLSSAVGIKICTEQSPRLLAVQFNSIQRCCFSIAILILVSLTTLYTPSLTLFRFAFLKICCI